MLRCWGVEKGVEKRGNVNMVTWYTYNPFLKRIHVVNKKIIKLMHIRYGVRVRRVSMTNLEKLSVVYFTVVVDVHASEYLFKK